jgi:hypothetical protein
MHKAPWTPPRWQLIAAECVGVVAVAVLGVMAVFVVLVAVGGGY